MNTKDNKIQWHPAFGAALQIACIYKSETEKVDFIPAKEITITFVCYHYPFVMLKKLKEERGITVKQSEKGIYYLNGDAVPIQLVIVPKLSKKNNYWLNNLRNNLKAGGEIREFIEQYEKNKTSELFQALADTIMRANWKELEEERKMCDALKELFADDLRESELKGKIEGKTEGAALKIIELVIKKYKKGCTVKETADMIEEPEALVGQLYEVISLYSSDYNVDKIYEKLLEKSNLNV